MKRLLISSIIFSVLILSAGACAPAMTVTSAPIETPNPPTSPTPLPPPLTPTNLPLPEATSTPEVRLEFCDLSTAPSLQEIKDKCTVPFDQLKKIDSELQRFSQPFDQSKFKKDVYITDAGRYIMFGTGDNGQYFKSDDEKPFRTGLIAYSTTKFEAFGQTWELDFLILPIEVPDPNDPAKTLWVKGIFPKPSVWEEQGKLNGILKSWQRGDSPYIYQNPYFSGIESDTGNAKNPVVEPTFSKNDMDLKFDEVISTDSLYPLTGKDVFVEVSSPIE